MAFIAPTQTHVHKDFGYLTKQGSPWVGHNEVTYQQFVTSDHTVVNLPVREVFPVVMDNETGMVMAD